MVTPLPILAKKYPRTMGALNRWLMAKDAQRPYTQFVRGKFEQLPIELVYGTLWLFFRERGINIVHRPLLSGRLRVSVFRRLLTGSYKRLYSSGPLVSGEKVMDLSLEKAFYYHERQLTKVTTPRIPDDSTVVVGVDTENLALSLT